MQMKMLLILILGITGPLQAAYLVPYKFDFTTSQFLNADPTGTVVQPRLSYSNASGTAYQKTSPGVISQINYGEQVQGIDGEQVGLGLGGIPQGQPIPLCVAGAYICKTVFSRAEADFGLLKAESHAVAAFGVTYTDPNTNKTTIYAGQTDVTTVAMFADIVQGNLNTIYSIDLSYAYDGILSDNAAFLYRLSAVYLDRGVMTPDGFVAPALMVSNVPNYTDRMDEIGPSFKPRDTTPGAYNDSGVFQIAALGTERILIFGQLLTFHQALDTSNALQVGGAVGGTSGARFFNTAKITSVAVSNGVTLNSENGVDWANIRTASNEVPEPGTWAMVCGAGLLLLLRRGTLR